MRSRWPMTRSVRGKQGAIEEDERGLMLGHTAAHRAALRTMLLHCAVTYRAS